MTSETAKDRLIVYIDGFNLYHGIHDAASHELLWLDIVQLAKDLRPASSVVQVKYFTATVLDEPDAQSRQDRYITALTKLHPGRLTVIRGEYKRRHKRCRTCGAKWISYEEKQTDVNMAIHIVADVSGGRADSYMIVSGDTDVIPAVKMGWSIDPNAVIFAQFPPGRSSVALKRMMPASREITLAKLRGALLPVTVTTRDGSVHTCPDKWLPVVAPTTAANPVPKSAAVTPAAIARRISSAPKACNHP